MKTYQYKDYEIYVQGAPTYSFNSVEYYDKILFMEESDFYCQIEMEITKDGEKKKVLLIAPRYTPMDSFVEVHEQGLFLMIDYLDNYYEIDYDGNVIVDRPF